MQSIAPLLRSLAAALLSGVLVFGVSSCGSSKSVSGASGRVSHKQKTEQTSKKRKSSAKGHIDTSGFDPVTAALLSEADQWRGTPYRYGGNDRNGVDCSGFVLQVYKRALGINLPRTSRQQSDYCTNIKKGKLQPGDLVFFATSKKHSNVSHVGIYVGHNRMIHASSSNGVIESDLESAYYSSHYHSSGRVDRFYAMVNEASSRRPERKNKKEEIKHQTAPASAAEANGEMLAQTPRRRSSTTPRKTSASKPGNAQTAPAPRKQSAPVPSATVTPDQLLAMAESTQNKNVSSRPSRLETQPIALEQTVQTPSQQGRGKSAPSGSGQLAKPQERSVHHARHSKETNSSSAAANTEELRRKVLASLAD